MPSVPAEAPSAVSATAGGANPLVDGHGRRVTYLRLSVTDRCDLRCTYCMPAHPRFAPRRRQLTLDELEALATAFVSLGVRKVRLTGGEPLVRRGILDLVRSLGRHVRSGALDEITLSTNGTQLEGVAADLVAAGVRRVNVSLDTLDARRYRELTRGGDIGRVLAGIDSARRAGLRVRINVVAIRGATEREVDDLIVFAHQRGMALALIETMPLGDTGVGRLDQYLSLAELQRALATRWTLAAANEHSGGPAHFVRIAETDGLLGFITPISCSFCALCNRVRVSSSGRLYTCLGSEQSVELVPSLNGDPDAPPLADAIRLALQQKPEGHRFRLAESGIVGIARHMSALGG